jgi:16S rRNA (guanine1207-N2)-methyltransferase
VAGSGDEHYFSRRPAARERPGEVVLALDDIDREVRLATDASVFSAGAVDVGTQFLLTDGARPSPDQATIVDLGCGYGPIAIALALRAPRAEVWAVDVNERALELCRENADGAGVARRMNVVAPDDVPTDLVADGIWSNPPVRIGKPALHELLSGWLTRLSPGGGAHLVVARNLGSDSLARWLTEEGYAVTRRASRRGYRLLDVLAQTA